MERTDAQQSGSADDAVALAAMFPNATDSGDQPTRETVRKFILERRGYLLLGSLFPAIASDTPLQNLALGVRIENLLRAKGETVFAALQEHSLDDVAGWRGIGTGSLEDMIDGLLDEALRLVLEPSVVESEQPLPRADEPHWIDGVADDVAVLARWHRILGSSDVPLLGAASGQFAPAAVRAARARLLSITAVSILPNVSQGDAAAALVEEILEPLSLREIEIVRDRVVADEPLTLDALGDLHGVTRERIRQIESKLIVGLHARLQEGEIGALAEAVRFEVHDVVPLRTLLQRIPTLAEIVTSVEQPVWRILDRFDDEYEIADGWCAPKSLAQAEERTRRILAEKSQNGRSVELASVDTTANLSPEWLSYLGVSTLSGFAFLGRASIPDRAEVVLQIAQEQLTSADLLAGLGVDRSLTALKNSLSADPRFTRVNRDEWALTSWGMDGYAPIHQLIKRALGASGGSLPLADLVSDLTGKFDVSPKSVVAYAASFPYTTERGIVRWRTRRDMRNRLPGKGLAQTRSLFRLTDEIALRVSLTGEHTRGSGSTLPNAIGEELDLGIGEARELTSASGAVTLTRPRAQIQLGSVRAEIQRLGLESGDDVFFVFAPGAEAQFRIERVEVGGSLDEQLALLTGGAVASRDLYEELADRIDAEQATKDGIRRALAARGDSDLVELIDATTFGADGAARSPGDVRR